MYKLTKTGIEFGTHSWNFYPGCKHKQMGVCPIPNCWAEGMSKRQREDFHNPHLIPERLLAPLSHKKPARILVDFMGDLGGNWVDPEMRIMLGRRDPDGIGKIGIYSLRVAVMDIINECPQHTFLFLTKRPEAWLKWGKFPPNCWVGATCWDKPSYDKALVALSYVEAKVKWLSIEPLYTEVINNDRDSGFVNLLSYYHIKWVVIGAQTKPIKFPEISWVREIVEACDKAGVKVFLKNNLEPLLKSDSLNPYPRWAFKDGYYTSEDNPFLDLHLRQELPL